MFESLFSKWAVTFQCLKPAGRSATKWLQEAASAGNALADDDNNVAAELFPIFFAVESVHIEIAIALRLRAFLVSVAVADVGVGPVVDVSFIDGGNGG